MLSNTIAEINFENILENFPENVFIINKSGFIEQNYLKNLELSDIVSKYGKSANLINLVPDYDKMKLRTAVFNVLTMGKDETIETIFTFGGKTYHYELKISRLSGKLLIILAHNINLIKEIALEIKTKERILEIGTRISEILLMSDDLKYNASRIIPLLGKTLGSDRSYLLYNNQTLYDNKIFDIIASWEDEDIQPAYRSVKIYELDMGYYFPDALATLKNGNYYEKSIGDLNVTSQRLMTEFNVKTLLFIPIIIKKELVAILHFHEVLKNHLRNGSELSALKIISELLASFIARRNQMRQLKISEEKFKLVFERSYDGIIITDAKGRITDWNYGMERIFMKHKAGIEGLYMWDFLFNQFPDEDKTYENLLKLKGSITEFLNTGGLNSNFYDYQTKIMGKDGGFKIIQAINTPIETDYGNMLCSIIRDITVQKEAESRLEDNLRFFETLIEVIPNPVFYKDLKSEKYLGCNKAFENLMGLPKHELIGKTSKEIYGNDNFREVVEQDGFVAESRSVQKFEFDLIQNDNTIKNLIIYKACYFDNNNDIAGIVGNIMDVTNIVESEKKLREYALGLELAKSTLEETVQELDHSRIEAEKANFAKNEFIAHMSHEFRTPMNAVIGMADLLSKNLKDPVNSNHIRLIKSAAIMLLSLINDILDLSKIEADKIDIYRQNVNLRNMLNEISDLFALKVAEKKISIEIEIPDSFPQIILMDEIRLKQIWLNLVGNAIKFTDFGYVKIKVGFEHSANYLNRINFTVQIIDTGIGIPQEMLEKIFEAFTQYKSNNSNDLTGTGLGLAIVRKLVHKMDGKIYVQSELGKGSEFFIHFYNIETDPTGNTEELESKLDLDNILFEKQLVFVLDSKEKFTELIEFYLEEKNIEILTFQSFTQFIGSLKSFDPNLIFVEQDSLTELIGGLEENQELKENFLKTPAIIVKNETNPKEFFNEYPNLAANITDTPSKKRLIELMTKYLKFSKNIINEDESSTEALINRQVRILNLPNKGVERFIEFFEELKSLNETCCHYFMLGKIEQFRDNVYDFAKFYDYPDLTDYADELTGFIEMMDVRKIKSKLIEFENFKLKLNDELK